jgi:hypothetical protein
MDELEIALAQLQNSNTDIRESALDKIGTLKPNNVFEIILPFLSDSKRLFEKWLAVSSH